MAQRSLLLQFDLPTFDHNRRTSRTRAGSPRPAMVENLHRRPVLVGLSPG